MMSVESTGVQTSPRGNSSVCQKQKYESSMPGPLTRNACLSNSTSMAGWHALWDEVVFHTLGKLVFFFEMPQHVFSTPPRLGGFDLHRHKHHVPRRNHMQPGVNRCGAQTTEYPKV